MTARVFREVNRLIVALGGTRIERSATGTGHYWFSFDLDGQRVRVIVASTPSVDIHSVVNMTRQKIQRARREHYS